MRELTLTFTVHRRSQMTPSSRSPDAGRARDFMQMVVKFAGGTRWRQQNLKLSLLRLAAQMRHYKANVFVCKIRRQGLLDGRELVET
jgi:hypothetical protein